MYVFSWSVETQLWVTKAVRQWVPSRRARNSKTVQLVAADNVVVVYLCEVVDVSSVSRGSETVCYRRNTGTVLGRCAADSVDAECSGQWTQRRKRNTSTDVHRCAVARDVASCTAPRTCDRMSCSQTADHRCDCSRAPSAGTHDWMTCCVHTTHTISVHNQHQGQLSLLSPAVGKLSTAWLGSVTVRTLDLRSRGCGFNSRSGRYRVVTTWMGDCLRTGKPSSYITNHQLSLPSHRGR